MKKLTLPFKVDSFVIAIIIVIGIGYIFPQWGIGQNASIIETISTIGIAIIFFLYGLKLSPDKLKEGLKNWQLHVLVQSATFLLFPVLVLAFYPFATTEQSQAIWLAFFFLAVLPSTVSSSVVMVSIARGNVPAAIFNASISGLIGIIVTPLWMGLFLKNVNTDFNLINIYYKLILGIILPVLMGILLQKAFGNFVREHSNKLTYFDKTIILLIIYKSFAESFANNIFTTVNVWILFLLFVIVAILFYLMYWLTGKLASWMGFSKADSITAQFCGTKKSLVHGTVFSKVILGSTSSLGLMLLPLMLFHALQIFIVSIIASKLSLRRD